MSIPLSEFWTRLVRSGITDAEGCRKLAAAFTKANSGTPASDSQAVARFLVKRGKLTKFQARALLATPPRELRAGSFVIRSDQSASPFSRWVEAARIDDGCQGMLLHVGSATENQALGDVLKRHAAANCATLQPLEPEFHSNAVLVFSPLPSGGCLSEAVSGDPTLPAAEVCRIGKALATALQTLHSVSLIHGQVRADRVWLSAEGHAILLRDPTVSMTNSSQAGWLDSLESPAFYSAPELPGQAQAASMASDIYALGCLLFRLTTGRLPFGGDSDADTIAAHFTETPPELAEAINRGESGDPLMRVIAFAMAKTPASRFASAEQLSAALQAVESMLDRTHAIAAEGRASSQDPMLEAGPKTAGEQGTVTRQRDPKPLVSDAASTSRHESADKPSASSSTEKLESRPAEVTESNRRRAANTKSDDTDAAAGEVEGRADAKSHSQPVQGKSHRSDRKQDQRKPIASPEQSNEAVGQPVGDDVSSSTVRSAADTETQPDASSIEPTSVATPSLTLSPAVTRSSEVPDLGSLPASDAGDASSITPPAETDRVPGRDQSLRRRRKKKSKAPLVLGALCVAVLMLMIGLMARDGSEPAPQKTPRRPPPSVIPPVSNLPTSTSQRPASVPTQGSGLGYELVSDDRLLFAPPYAADSPSPPLELLPPGPAVVVTARLAPLMGDRDGSLAIDEISAELNELLELASNRAKTSPESIRRLSVALHPGKEGWPEVSLVVELNEAIPKDELISRLEVDAARTSDGATIYVGEQEGSDAFYWNEPESDLVSRFAIGSITRISEVAAVEGGTIPLPRSAQSLWDGASDTSELVVLFTPNFLFADGRELLLASAPELTRPLRRLMQPDVAAAIISVKLSAGDRVFVEAMFSPSGGISEAALMRNVSDAVQSWPQWADQFILKSVPDPSWRLLASRLPSMMRFVVGQARFGVSDGMVVVNAYLPAKAFPQVTLATVLAMNTPSSAVAVPTTVAVADPLTVDQMLDRPMTVSFDQESLEFALEAIVNAFKDALPPGSVMPPARIIGGDLQLMGITQNQQVRDFSKTNLPLRTVLTDLVVGANPDKSATGPSDSKQSLIWVVSDDPVKPGQKEIVITTRPAALTKNYALPLEFEIKPAAEE